jgi:hypothetical protein
MLVLLPSICTAFVVLTDPAAKRASSSPQASLSIKRAIAKHVSDHKVDSFKFARMMIDGSNVCLSRFDINGWMAGSSLSTSFPKGRSRSRQCPSSFSTHLGFGSRHARLIYEQPQWEDLEEASERSSRWQGQDQVVRRRWSL